MDLSPDDARRIAELERTLRTDREQILDEARYGAELAYILEGLRRKGKTELIARYEEAAAEAAALREQWAGAAFSERC